MSKFEDIMSRYEKIIEEMPVQQPKYDVSALDQMTGVDMEARLQAAYGQDPAALEGIMTALTTDPNAVVDPNAVDPNAVDPNAVADPTAAAPTAVAGAAPTTPAVPTRPGATPGKPFQRTI